MSLDKNYNDFVSFMNKYYPTLKCDYKGDLFESYKFKIEDSFVNFIIILKENRVVVRRILDPYGAFNKRIDDVIFSGYFNDFKKAMFNNVFSMVDYKIKPVEKLKKGEYVRKSLKGKVFTKGEYDRSLKKYELDDCGDISNCIYVKKGTLLYYDFIF